MKMMRKFSALAVVVLLLSCLAASAFASDANLYYVTDTADVFSETEWVELEHRAEAISEKYQVGVYIIVLDDFKRYADSSQVWYATKEIYEEQNLGWGADHAGAVILLSMAERDYALDFYSERAQYAFTEAGQDRLEDRVLGYFRNNDFYGGFKEYLNVCDEYLEAAAQGHPVGEGERSSVDEEGIGFLAVVPGIIAAVLTGAIMSSSMHTAKEQHDADVYAVQGSMNIRRSSDMFLHRSVVRTPRQTSSSGGSHGTHHSSGGHSGRSGKF